MWLTRLAIRRRVTMIMIVGAFMVLGYTRMTKMPLEYFPDVEFPIVTVTIPYPGAGPDEIQERVTKPVEDQVAIINGVDDVTSQSQENVATVIIMFDLEIDVNVAAADVRDAVTRARATFPDDVSEPTVYKLDFSSAPIVSMGVTGDRPPKNLRDYVEERIKPDLGGVPGVASVNITGGETREVQIQADEARLEAVGLSVLQLAQLVAAENLNIPGGELKEGARSFAVRALGEFEDLEEIRRLRIPTPLGGVVYLEELADVVDTTEEKDTITRLDGSSVVNVNIMGQSGANQVAVSAGIHEALAGLKERLPEDLTFSIYYDSADDTQEAIADVRSALILGALLAALVTYVFLHNFRALIIVCVAIPTSLIAAFLPMYIFGFTINVMTLLGLSLVVGTLVDDSIVVIENIERHRAMGEDPREAAINGRAEISGAAVATTMVDIVVFVPVAFMGGIVGRFFFPFGITVACASIFSLLAAFTLTPMLASWWFSRETAEAAAARKRSIADKLFTLVDLPFGALQRGYRKFLPLTLRHPYAAVLMGYVALVVVSYLAVASGRVGFEFFPEQATGRVQVLLETAPGTRIEVMDKCLATIEERVMDEALYPEVRHISVTAGTQGSGFEGVGNFGGRYGSVTVMLTGKTERRLAGLRTDREFANALREHLGDLPSVDVKVVRQTSEGGGSEAPVMVVLKSPDAEALDRAARDLAGRLRQSSLMMYPDVSSELARPEVIAQIDRVRASDLGFTASEIAGTLRAAYAGDTSSQFRESGDEFDLRVQLREVDRTTLSGMGNLFVGLSDNGQVVRLQDVADIRQGTGPSRIERYDRERAVVVSSYLADGIPLGTAAKTVEETVAEMRDAGAMQGINWRWTGEFERQTENNAFLFEAMGLAGILIYIVVAALYAHVLQPLNVMLTIPMAFGGAMLTLSLWGANISIASLIGVIMLMGLVGKNAILVVDYTNTLRARGEGLYDALMEAGPTRMRPIFMTTISTVAALLPTALALSEAAEFRAPMAQVVVGGLLVSTVLSLLITPAFYVITSDITDLYSRALAGLGGLFRRRSDGGD